MIGTLALAFAVAGILALTAGVIWYGPSIWLARRSHPSRDRARWKLREPLFWLRLRTWRKRRGAPGGTLIDAPSIPLTPGERKTLKEMR